MRLLSDYYQHATGSTFRCPDADEGRLPSGSDQTTAPARQPRRESKDAANAMPPPGKEATAGAAGALTIAAPSNKPAPTAVAVPATDAAIGKQPAASLGRVLGVRQRFLRSANVERDSDGRVVLDYIPTERALEALRRIVRAMREPFPTRAWSLTDPTVPANRPCPVSGRAAWP